jgi:RHS repeat-associated protein
MKPTRTINQTIITTVALLFGLEAGYCYFNPERSAPAVSRTRCSGAVSMLGSAAPCFAGYRYYNASTGRWLSRDPIGETGARNLYGFANNNATSASDKLGMVVVNLTYSTYIETARITYSPVFGVFPARTFNGGVKTRHSVLVDTDSRILTEVDKYVGPTFEYDSQDKITGSGQADGSTVKAGLSGGLSSIAFTVTMSGNESNPLVSFAPGITYSVSIRFDTCSETITWKGTHDRFPSHDFYLKGDLVHRFSHVAAGTNPDNLWWPGSEHFGGQTTF